MAQLALLGGKPIRTKLFPAYNTIGDEEKRAVQAVLDSGNLSQFIGAMHDDFFGGPKVRGFEDAWKTTFHAKHALTVNSNTSGLFAAMGAVGVGPGDEVIVSPYTMSASAIAPIIYGAVPVFADIDPDIFCLSPAAIEKAITPRTKAILVVHIFGNPADMDEILAIARKHKIAVVEDCAQAPGAEYKGRPVGTIGDIGIFSFNYHKHIHTGEGGMITTNSDSLAERLSLIRNHGENVVGPMNYQGPLENLWGYNYRMTEMEAAIGIEQLRKLPALNVRRLELAARFTKKFASFPGFTPPLVRQGNKHVYYSHPLKFNRELVGISRATYVAAVKAEIPSAVLREKAPLIGEGYVKPLYHQPIYQQKAGRCAFNCPRYEGETDYRAGLCAVTERLHFEELVSHEYHRPAMSDADVEDVFRALDKVYENLDALRAWEKSKAK